MLGTEGANQAENRVLFLGAGVTEVFPDRTVGGFGFVIAHVVAFAVMPVQGIQSRVVAVLVKNSRVCLDILPKLLDIVIHSHHHP